MITHVKCRESKGAREAVMELLKQLHLAEYSQTLGGKPYFSNSYRSQWDRHGMSNVQKLCFHRELVIKATSLDHSSKCAIHRVTDSEFGLWTIGAEVFEHVEF